MTLETDGHMKRSYAHLFLVLASILLILPAAFALLLPANANSSEVLDQSNDPTPSVGFAPGLFPASYWQSFRSTLSQLTSVDVRLENINTSAREVTLKIVEGTPAGAVMVTQNVQVPGNLLYPGTLFHVTFGLPIQVTPGSTYLIEIHWGSTNSTGIYWDSPDADTYPNGNGFGPGGSPAGWDLNFQTWGPQKVGGEVMPSPLAAIIPMAAVVGAVSLAVTVPLVSKRLRQR